MSGYAIVICIMLIAFAGVVIVVAMDEDDEVEATDQSPVTVPEDLAVTDSTEAVAGAELAHLPEEMPEEFSPPVEFPELPMAPENPQIPTIPEVPTIPAVPAVPEVPELPEVPETPETPEASEKG